MRRGVLIGSLGLALVVGLALGLALNAGATLRCWGSICQDANSTVYLSRPVTAQETISLSTVAGAFTIPGDVVLACTRTAGLAPGFAAGTLRLRPGTLPNTMQLMLIVGTSGAEVPIGPPIAGGSC